MVVEIGIRDVKAGIAHREFKQPLKPSDWLGRAYELAEQQVAHAQPEEIDADAADALLGVQRDRYERIHEPHHSTDAHPYG